MARNPKARSTAGRRVCVLALLSIGSLILGVPPTQAGGQGWDFFDASSGCHNAVREVHVTASKSPSVKRILVRARAGHSVSVEDARQHRILFTDFNCKTNREAIKLARIGSQVTIKTLRGPTSASLYATFTSSGRRAVIGWDTDTGVNVVKVSLATGKVVSRRSWAGIGYLDDLDSGNNGAIYLQVHGWTLSSGSYVRVLSWSGNHLTQRFKKSGRSSMSSFNMSVSSFDVIGIATDTAPGRLFIRSETSYPFSRVGICGGGTPWDFTWLGYRVGLANCATGIGASRYQFVDLRGSTPNKTWLGRFWGIDPVGLG